MSKKTRTSVKSYQNNEFLSSTHARELRILAEYLEPENRFAHYQVDDTIVFFGSARYVSREQAEEELENAKHGDGDLEQAKTVELADVAGHEPTILQGLRVGFFEAAVSAHYAAALDEDLAVVGKLHFRARQGHAEGGGVTRLLGRHGARAHLCDLRA